MTDTELSSRYWLVRKVICLVGYYGGFRNVEMKSLLFENVECDSMGFWFTFSRSKQRNKLEETTICVPRRQSDWMPCSEDSGRLPVDYDPASVIDTYLEAVMKDLDCNREDLKGGFFKGTHGKAGKRFVNANVGKNTLAQVGIEVASELCLRDPETFTGHCWRRSAGTNASNSGVNVTTLMSMMGWACPKTAIQYVKRSRITSLQMSMYLANVQRRNCSDPFPSVVERVSRKKKFRSDGCVSGGNRSSGLTSKTTTSTTTSASAALKTTSSFESKYLESEAFDGQGLRESSNVGCVRDCEATSITTSSSVSVQSVPSSCAANVVSYESEPVNPVVTPASVVNPASFDLSSVDPRLMNFLHNLQNHGNIQIHFNFGEPKK